jgi:pyridinium-3,5-bisthiocarboxylic acid mononucleotide nickel chelatase
MTTTLLYIDPFSGISGDMTVGALVDLGAPEAELTAGLESLNTGATFRFEKTVRRGIRATKFHVDINPEHHKPHRHLPHILRIIEAGALADAAKQNAGKVFQKLGAAEAAVHGVPIEKVHFHEVGAVDSICDIVGACVGLGLLGVDRIVCAPVNVGGGTVKTEHGVLPVPAPATAALLEGHPVYSRGPQMELTTPTGAALATTLAESFGPMPAMTIRATGYGAGDRDFTEHANVLRLISGVASGATEAVTIAVIEASIDDSTPQLLGHAMETLLAAGALDVSLTPQFMKKNRPGIRLEVLAKLEDRERLARMVLDETTTLGIRMYTAERRVAERQIVEVETPYGKVRIKVSPHGFAPEYEDCRALAGKAGVPLKTVLAEASFAYLKNSR